MSQRRLVGDLVHLPDRTGSGVGRCRQSPLPGAEQWQPASPFWDAPDRNDHAPAMWADESGTLYHFNGLSAAATWGNTATILRTSTDSGATWSKARLINPEHGMRHMPVESVFRTREGNILLPCDAVPGGQGGTAIHLSSNNGATWTDPGDGRPQPDFANGTTAPGSPASTPAVVQLPRWPSARLRTRQQHRRADADEHLGRPGQPLDLPASPFPPISGGQRCVLLRLREGPIFFASFAKRIMITDASGNERPVSGLFAALSVDEGQTWQIRRLISDDGPPRVIDGGGNTGKFTMSIHSAEPRGYLSVCQTPDGVIHLISSKQHYAFNLAWLNTPAPRP